jgi:hypothetical protein
MSQLAGTGDKVGMDVRLGDVSDFEPFGIGRLEVGVDIPVGVHHESLATPSTTDEVARLSKFGVVEAAEEHGQGLWVLAMGYEQSSSSRASDGPT